MDTIRIRGARTHNLQNVDLDLPRDKLIVITGRSGSGKSSLAFDTIFAEGQRRYVESLSAGGLSTHAIRRRLSAARSFYRYMLGRGIASSSFHFKGEPVQLTLSAGITETRPGDNVESIYERADEALYQAKNSGRNCQFIAS